LEGIDNTPSQDEVWSAYNEKGVVKWLRKAFLHGGAVYFADYDRGRGHRWVQHGNRAPIGDPQQVVSSQLLSSPESVQAQARSAVYGPPPSRRRDRRSEKKRTRSGIERGCLGSGERADGSSSAGKRARVDSDADAAANATRAQKIRDEAKQKAACVQTRRLKLKTRAEAAEAKAEELAVMVEQLRVVENRMHVVEKAAPDMIAIVYDRQMCGGIHGRGKKKVSDLNPRHYGYRSAIRVITRALTAMTGVTDADPDGAHKVLAALARAYTADGLLMNGGVLSPNSDHFLGAEQLTSLKFECGWTANQLRRFLLAFKPNISTGLLRHVSNVDGVVATIKAKVVPRGRPVAKESQAVLKESARTVPIWEHIVATVNSRKLQDELLVGFNHLGPRFVFAVSADKLGVSKNESAEVSYFYPLSCWRTRHAVKGTTYVGIFDIDEKDDEVPVMAQELFHPGQSILEHATAILKGEDPLAVEAAIRALAASKKVLGSEIGADAVRASSLGIDGWASFDPVFNQTGGTSGFHNPFPPVSQECFGPTACAVCRSNWDARFKTVAPDGRHHYAAHMLGIFDKKTMDALIGNSSRFDSITGAPLPQKGAAANAPRPRVDDMSKANLVAELLEFDQDITGSEGVLRARVTDLRESAASSSSRVHSSSGGGAAATSPLDGHRERTILHYAAVTVDYYRLVDVAELDHHQHKEFRTTTQYIEFKERNPGHTGPNSLLMLGEPRDWGACTLHGGMAEIKHAQSVTVREEVRVQTSQGTHAVLKLAAGLAKEGWPSKAAALRVGEREVLAAMGTAAETFTMHRATPAELQGKAQPGDGEIVRQYMKRNSLKSAMLLELTDLTSQTEPTLKKKKLES
jgi:hypothetical protein